MTSDRARYDTAIEIPPLCDDGYGITRCGKSVFAVDAWRRDVADGCLVDYDGHGHPINNGLVDRTIRLRPSRVADLPPDATHVLWINR